MPPTSVTDPGGAAVRGAYGLGVRVVGEAGPIVDSVGLLTGPPDLAPVIDVERRLDVDSEPVTDEDRILSDDQMQWPLLLGGRLDVSRASRRAVVTTPFAIDDADLVHPYLSPIGAIWARWLGREPFHCSAALLDGKVWGILGPREAGKSTLVAWLATHDVPIMTDDLLVVASGSSGSGPGSSGEGTIAFAGPRSIDLRPPTYELLRTDGVDVSGFDTVRGGERYRIRLGDVPWSAPMGGWFILDTEASPGVPATDVTVTGVPVPERLRVLADHRMVRRDVADGIQWMELATLPTFHLVRPKDWALMGDVVGAMRGAVAGVGAR